MADTTPLAQAALALVGQLNAQGIVASPIVASPTVSPDRKLARVELSPDSGVQTTVSRQLFVPQVPEGYVPPALPHLPSRVPYVVPQPQPQPQNSDNNLVEQMRLMMQGMLQGTESRLTSSFQSNVDSLRADLTREREERESGFVDINARLDAQDARLSAMGAAPQSHGQRSQSSDLQRRSRPARP